MSDDVNGESATGFAEVHHPATVELTDRAILARDLLSFVLFWNPAACELYGYSADEAVGRCSHDLLATRFPKPLADIDAELLDTGSWEGPLLHLTKAGEPLLVISRWVLQRAADGSPEAILEFNRRAADPLEELRWLAPVAHEPVDRLYIHEPMYDADGELVDLRLRYANEEVRIVQGEHPSIAMPTGDWFPHFRESRLFEVCREVLATGRPQEFRDVELHPPWEDEPFIVGGRVVPFGELVVIRARDDTARRRAEQALDDAQARVRVALAAAPVNVMQTDRDLVTTWVNPDMDPALADSLMGSRAGSLMTPESRTRFREAAERTLATGREERLEFRLEEGRDPDALSMVIQARWDGDEVAGLVIVVLDISEQWRRERELLDDLAAGALRLAETQRRLAAAEAGLAGQG